MKKKAERNFSTNKINDHVADFYNNKRREDAPDLKVSNQIFLNLEKLQSVITGNFDINMFFLS